MVPHILPVDKEQSLSSGFTYMLHTNSKSPHSPPIVPEEGEVTEASCLKTRHNDIGKNHPSNPWTTSLIQWSLYFATDKISYGNF